MKSQRYIKYSLLLLFSLFLIGCQPIVIINSPEIGEQFEIGEEITFSAFAIDFIDGSLSENSLVWTSSIDDEIGIGTTFTRDDLSEGIHEITLTATNSLGKTGTATITISIGDTILITDSSQLISILNSLTYKYFGSYTTGNLPISEDIQIIGTVTISSLQIEVPEECDNKDCRLLVTFSDDYGVDGISLFSNLFLTLTNVKLRFRTLILDMHPVSFSYNFHPVIRLLPPSDHECDDTQTWCAVDQVCYDPNPFCPYCAYCQYCLALSQEECVCRDEDGIFPDETDCEIWVSNDARMTGKCQDGACVIEGLNNYLN